MKKTKNLLTTLLGLMLIVCVAFTTLSLSKTSKAKAEDESDVYLFEVDGGGVLTSAPIAFETALSGGAANAKLFMEFGFAEDVSFGTTAFYFGFGDATPGADNWGLMTSSNTMCLEREDTETAENNFRVFKGYPNTYAWKSDNDATYAPYSALFAEGVKIQFEVDIYAGAIQQYFLKVWDSVNEEYVSINDAWLTGDTIDAGDITNWCIYLQVNNSVSMKLTDPKFYAIDGSTTKNLEILKSTNVTKFEKETEEVEEDPSVYLFEVDGGGVLTSAPIAFETALSGGAANAKLFVEFGLFEDVSFGTTQFYFGFGDATPGASDWGLMTSSNTMCLEREDTETAENNFRVFKGYPNTYAWKSDNDATYAPYSALFAEGVKIQFEVDIYAGAIQQYFLKVWDSVNEEYVSINDAWFTGETIDAGDITNWCIYLQVNNSVSMKLTDPKFYAVDGETTKDLTILKSSNVTKFEEYDPYGDKHTVSFMNGESEIKSLRVDDSTSINTADIPVAPSVTGKIFDHWAVDGNLYSFSTPVVDDLVIEAVYRDNTGKCGITNLVYGGVGDPGEYGYHVRFDTYISSKDTANGYLTDLHNEGANLGILIDGEKPAYNGGYYWDTAEMHLTLEDANNSKIVKLMGYQSYIEPSDYEGKDSIILTFKAGTTVGENGEVLDHDYNYLVDFTGDYPIFTLLTSVVDETYDNGTLVINFDAYVSSTISIYLKGGLKINGKNLAELGVEPEYVGGDYTKTVKIDLSNVELNDVNTITIDKDVKVNQDAAVAAIHQLKASNGKIENETVCYLVKSGDSYIVDEDGTKVFGIVSESTKEYSLGDEFDLSAVTAKDLHYDGTLTDIDLTGATFTGYDKDTLGKQTVTVTLSDERTFTLEVVVNDIVVGITASTTKTTYNYGEDLDLTAFTAKETLQQTGEGETVEISEITGYDKNVLGEQTLTVKYETFTATVVVTVVDYVSDYQVVCTKEKVYVKEALTKDDFEVTEVMASGANGQKVTVTGIVGFNANTLGQQTVVVSFGENSKEVVVTVIDKATGIEVASQITEVEFGAELDLSKISVKYVMASGADGEAVAITKDNIEGYDASKAGVQTVTVKVGDFTATFGVQVNEEVKASGCTSNIGFSSVSFIALVLCAIFVIRKKKEN